jgi:serine/threonine protein kinase
LGKGQFATVYQAIDSETNKIYAIKCQSKNLSQENERYRSLLNSEIKIMHTIFHQNIIHLYELMESLNNYYLIIDYCNRGDFHKYMRSRKITCLPEKEAIFFLKQIMNGFKELRNYEIMHRDIKLENLLVSDNIVKIADFGMAKIGGNIANTIVGSYLTMAPELFVNNPNSTYTSKADLWSIGFIYYQLLFGEYPFYGLSPNEIANDIRLKSGNLKFKTAISNGSQDLLNRLLQMNPDDRIDWPEFFAHSIFVQQFPKSLRDFIKKETTEDNLNQSEVKVDQEFIKNQQEFLKLKVNEFPQRPRTLSSKKRNESFSSLESPSLLIKTTNTNNYEFTSLGDNASVNEEIVNEKEISNIKRAQNCSEVAKRYKHEKYKIAFIVYVVRNIRKLMKTAQFAKIVVNLSMIAILLMKKAITLNDLNAMSLCEETNIFDQPGFNDLLKSSFFETVLEYFQKDKPNFESYLQYLLDYADKINLSVKDKVLLHMIKNESIRLGDLDDQINSYYSCIRKFEVGENEEIRHEFVLMMVSIFYGVHCEVYFPYKINNVKFQWNEFYDLHERMNDDQLLKIIE